MKTLTVVLPLILALGASAGVASAQEPAPVPAEVPGASAAGPAGPPDAEPAPPAEPAPVTDPAPAIEAPLPAEPVVPMSDADLGALVADETAGGGEKSYPLEIYGFMDFTYSHLILKKGQDYGLGGYPQTNFGNGNINVYFAKKLTERCRTLLEVRFLYLPGGSLDSTNTKYIDGTAQDHADFYRPLRWGGIEIERAHGECDLYQGLTLRIGQWLTPYGIWNIDHGTPALIALRRPFVIGNELFPERQTGLQLLGARNFGAFRLGYAATISNGRGPIEAFHDLDNNKALGGRLELMWTGAAEVTVGSSYYRGRYTSADPVPLFSTEVPLKMQYDEQSIGFDLQVNWRGLAVRAEHIINERAYTEKGRPLGTNGTYLPDDSQYGYYGLVGYRLPWFGIMPYLLYMQIHPVADLSAPFVAKLWGAHGGVNILINPYLVLKIEYMMSGIIDPPDSPPQLKDKLKNIEAQIAWVF